jgi:methionine synthase II (cobalamin-independent)
MTRSTKRPQLESRRGHSRSHLRRSRPPPEPGAQAAVRAAITCEEAFTPAVSPTDIANWNANEHYRTDEKFPVALTDALHEEYQKIVDAGLLLQIDDPQLVNMGPRVHDMELQHIVDIMLGVQATAYSLEAGNPRHEHERRVRELVKLPESKLLIPGIITHASNLVEHPEAVAPRIGRFCRCCRVRKCDRRGRLRLCQPFYVMRGPPERRLGQIGRTGQGRSPRDERIVGQGLMGRHSQREQ